MMFANRWMGGNGYGNPNANTSTQAQIQALQNVVQDNHNSDLLMQAENRAGRCARICIDLYD